MDKVSKDTSSLAQLTSQRNALIVGEDDVTMRLTEGQLVKEGYSVSLLKDEILIFSHLKRVHPDLILLQLNSSHAIPVDEIAKRIFQWSLDQAKEMNRLLKSPSHLLWPKTRVILYRTENQMEGATSVSAEAIDFDAIVSRCADHGDVLYIGIYASYSFISKLRKYLKT